MVNKIDTIEKINDTAVLKIHYMKIKIDTLYSHNDTVFFKIHYMEIKISSINTMIDNTNHKNS